MNYALLSWCIAALSSGGIPGRPFRWPEAVWAVAGALLIFTLGLLPVGLAWQAIGKGIDVYLFLTCMMLLPEVGRREGLFDWPLLAVNHAKRAQRRSARGPNE